MTIMDNHHLAMELADKADQSKRLGQFDKSKKYFKEAFDLERLAALKLQDRQAIEPTRSILFRSAASLAIECEELREAERMIAFGLTGNPPDEIAEELRDLLERVNFERHLHLRGITLDPNEFQLSIWGPAIGLGFAQSRVFRERVEKVEALSFRTLERKLNKPFREAGRPTKDVADIFDVYVSVPRAASFAVTLRLASNQLRLPDFDMGLVVVEEMIECLELLNKRDENTLKKRINEEAYFENFVSLAKQIAPDGKRVSQVGLTLQRDGEEKMVRIERKKSEWDTIAIDKGDNEEDEKVEIRGILRAADATKKQFGMIELLDQQNALHKIKVPLGMMADIVRPMFDYEVVVKGRRDNSGNVHLEDIDMQNEE